VLFRSSVLKCIVDKDKLGGSQRIKEALMQLHESDYVSGRRGHTQSRRSQHGSSGTSARSRQPIRIHTRCSEQFCSHSASVREVSTTLSDEHTAHTRNP